MESPKLPQPKATLELAQSFEQILPATLRMVRTQWKVSICMFMQMDDHGQLRIRAAEGLSTRDWVTAQISPSKGVVAQCIGKSEIAEVGHIPDNDPFAALLNPALKSDKHRFVLVPVAGEARTLGILVVGPFIDGQEIQSRAGELRSAGALCAVLSAHWRLYEWVRNYIPEANHGLRTPLTAVQGSLGMVLGGVFGQIGGEVREMLEMAQKGCERTVRALEEYLNNQKPPKDEK